METATFLAEWGLPGAILGLSFWAIGKQWVRNNELSDARHTDQKQHTEQLISMQRDHTGQLMASTDTLRRALDVVEAK